MDVIHDMTHFHFTHSFFAFRLDRTNVLSTPWGTYIHALWHHNLVCWSSFHRCLAIEQGFPDSTRYVFGGVNTDFYRPDNYEKDGYLLFMGRMHPTKRPHIFIELARRMPQEKFILSGSFGRQGTPDHAYYGRYYRELSRNLPNLVIEEDVSFKRQVQLYQRAKSLIFPSQAECFGLVLAQALSCGTPAICSNEGAFPEIIQEGKTGFLCDTLEEYINAIKNIDVIDPKDCVRDARQRFSRERVAHDYLKVYHDAMDGKTW